MDIFFSKMENPVFALIDGHRMVEMSFSTSDPHKLIYSE
jgi:hypothetical protein